MDVAEYKGKRILLTTVCRDSKKTYDYWAQNVSKKVRYSFNKYASIGLRFIKANVPEIEILESPFMSDYEAALDRGYDVVGFSFYTHNIPAILEMARMAREKGVKELWAGNYGAITYGMEEHFDRIFTGYAEHTIAKEMGRKINRLKHPVLVEIVSLPGNIGAFPLGVVNSTRGCTNNCSFCQTPVFCSGISHIPLESIEESFLFYKNMGVNNIIFSDESFGLQKKYTDKIIDLLVKYNFDWYAMPRVDTLEREFNDWFESGLSGVFIGIENLRQSSLDDMGKNFTVKQTTEILRALEGVHAFTVGYYMIGFEDDTVTSIKRDIKELNRYSIDMLQTCVLTPLPRTELWDHIDEKYGIFEKDWSKWDMKNLVWNHPTLSQDDIKDLLKWVFRTAYPQKRFIQTPMKYLTLRRKRYGTARTVSMMTSDVWKANLKFKKPLPP